MTRLAVCVGLVLTGLVSLGCDSREPEPEGAFYLEARVVVTDDRPGIGGGRAATLGEPAVTNLTWAYRDDQHYRHEFHVPHPILDWGPRWTVVDGDDVVSYDPRLGSYGRTSVPDGRVAAYPTFSALIGPMPAADFDTYLAIWTESGASVERAGTEEFLGRAVEVIEYGPTWSSSSGTSDGQQRSESGGVGRLYVDVEGGFVLRHVMEGGPDQPSLAAEVTLLDLDPDFDDDRLDALIPSEALEGTDSRSCPSAAEEPSFAYIPPGWITAGSGVSRAPGCQSAEHWSNLRRGEGEVIVLRSRAVPPTGLPAIRSDATPVDLGGLEGYRLTVGNIERLLWVEDGVIVLIETNAASFEDLMRMALAERDES